MLAETAALLGVNVLDNAMLHCGFMVAANTNASLPQGPMSEVSASLLHLYMVTKWLLVPPIPASCVLKTLAFYPAHSTRVLTGSQHSRSIRLTALASMHHMEGERGSDRLRFNM